jgi:Fe-S oxidoreductase
MLMGLIKGELKMSETINRYLDLCLKCGACAKFCPSGIDVVDIIALAKAEYFKLHKIEKFKSSILKFLLNVVKRTHILSPKSKKYDKKVIYFGGCGGANKSVIKILNSMNIEVITPNFDCCGFPFFVNGDMANFADYADKFYSILEQIGDYEIVTNCATCEKTIKSYQKWKECAKEIKVKNVFEYIRENNPALELKKNKKVTFHKPCNLNNFEDVKYILENTKNLEYIEMEDFDKCCGLEGVTNIKEFKTMSKLFGSKSKSIRESGAKIVLTSCLACKITLSLYSFCRYKVYDFIEFLAKNVK